MSQHPQLATIPCSTFEEFLALQGSALFEPRFALELDLARRLGHAPRFTIPGFCALDRQLVEFSGDWRHACAVEGAEAVGVLLPNWRESLVCPLCKLNNRQRAVVTLLWESLKVRKKPANDRSQVYLMEQITPMYQHLTTHIESVEWFGSEYLGPDHDAGSIYGGIRHEDAHRLSFADDSFDMAVSCSVLEHVPDPWQVMKELARVIRPGGELYLEVPFHSHTTTSVRRAEIVEGELVHHLPTEYHDNPTAPEGVLVYYDFGWDLIDQMRHAGFSDCKALVYWSWELGHLGGTQSIFHAIRNGEPR